MTEIRRLHSGKRISRVVIHNGIAYLAGIIALQKHGQSVAEQTGTSWRWSIGCLPRPAPTKRGC